MRRRDRQLSNVPVCPFGLARAGEKVRLCSVVGASMKPAGKGGRL